MEKYGEDEWPWFPGRVPSYRVPGLLRNILKLGDASSFYFPSLVSFSFFQGRAMFHKGVGFKVGLGGCVWFWVDDWLGVVYLGRKKGLIT